MITDRPESRYHSNAAVLMSQPLKSSWARRPSSRYTAGEFGPPLWNCTLISCPIPADGTMRYSTGRPGREKAPAVAEPPTTPMRAGSTAAASATTVSRRTHAPRILPTNFMLDLSHLSYAARGTCPTDPSRVARAVNHKSLWLLYSACIVPGRSQRLSVAIRSNLRACSCAPRYDHARFPAG